jgi:hypothetical protein
VAHILGEDIHLREGDFQEREEDCSRVCWRKFAKRMEGFFMVRSTSSRHFVEVVHFIFAGPPYSDVELMQAIVPHRTSDAEAYIGAF